MVLFQNTSPGAGNGLFSPVSPFPWTVTFPSGSPPFYKCVIKTQGDLSQVPLGQGSVCLSPWVLSRAQRSAVPRASGMRTTSPFQEASCDLIPCPGKEENRAPAPSGSGLSPALPGREPVRVGSLATHPWRPRVQWEMSSACGLFATGTKRNSSDGTSVLH